MFGTGLAQETGMNKLKELYKTLRGQHRCIVCDTPGALFVDDDLSVCPQGCGNRVYGSTVQRVDGLLIIQTIGKK